MYLTSTMPPNKYVGLVHSILYPEFTINEKVNLLLLHFDQELQSLIGVTKLFWYVVL